MEMDKEDMCRVRDYRRQQIIEKAVNEGDRWIMKNTDGSVEELNYLTAAVAKKWMEKALHPLVFAVMKYDAGLEVPENANTRKNDP